MKKILSIILLVLGLSLTQNVSAQTYTQSYVDKCTGELKLVTTQIVNGNYIISFYNQVRTFTATEVMSGVTQAWLTAVYTQYSTMGCPTNQVVTQTVQATVSQATSQAASAAASTASSAASSAASTSASTAATSSTSSTPPPTSSSSGSSTSAGSGSSSSSSTESKTETKTETKSETKSESKEETKSESKSEEKKEESKSEDKQEENKEESKEEKKEEKKKGRNSVNPMLVSADMAGTQDPEGRYAAMMSAGISRSSLMGDKSYSATALIWSTLDQYALSGGMTKMDFEDGKLNGIHSYSVTAAYLKGTWMQMLGYTYVKPHPKWGTYGYNVGLITLQIKNPMTQRYNLNVMTSFVGFWTKPYQINRKTTISPQVFIMNSPISYTPNTQATLVTRTPGFVLGSGYDFRISKRFAFSAAYRAIISLEPNFNLMNNFQIGSKMVL
jgi:hypothetical protein